MAVSKRTRFEVFRRDNHTCRYCRSADNPIRVDHVTPVALGGTDDPSNLVTACQDCNAGKSSTSPGEQIVEDVKADAARWAAAMGRAAEIMDEQIDEREAYIGALLEAWPSYKYLPDSVVQTAERMYSLGLPVSVMADAARTAGTNTGVMDRSAYFGGICWKRLRAMREIAEQIVAGDDAP